MIIHSGSLLKHLIVFRIQEYEKCWEQRRLLQTKMMCSFLLLTIQCMVACDMRVCVRHGWAIRTRQILMWNFRNSSAPFGWAWHACAAYSDLRKSWRNFQYKRHNLSTKRQPISHKSKTAVTFVSSYYHRARKLLGHLRLARQSTFIDYTRISLLTLDGCCLGAETFFPSSYYCCV